MQVSLVDGAMLELLSDTVVFTPAGMPSVELVISPTSGGRLPSIDPRTPLAARIPYRPYVINLQAPPGDYPSVDLRVPAMRVDGQVFPERHVSFAYREKKGAMSCMQ